MIHFDLFVLWICSDVAQTFQKDGQGSGADVLVRNCHIWTSSSNLKIHYDKHGDDMGFSSQTEYEYAAMEFMCMCEPNPNLQVKRIGGKTYFFDATTSEFGVVGNKGIMTYQTPTQRYFDNLKG